jgi:hypothetical protein
MGFLKPFCTAKNIICGVRAERFTRFPLSPRQLPREYFHSVYTISVEFRWSSTQQLVSMRANRIGQMLVRHASQHKMLCRDAHLSEFGKQVQLENDLKTNSLPEFGT